MIPYVITLDGEAIYATTDVSKAKNMFIKLMEKDPKRDIKAITLKE